MNGPIKRIKWTCTGLTACVKIDGTWIPVLYSAYLTTPFYHRGVIVAPARECHFPTRPCYYIAAYHLFRMFRNINPLMRFSFTISVLFQRFRPMRPFICFYVSHYFLTPSMSSSTLNLLFIP